MRQRKYILLPVLFCLLAIGCDKPAPPVALTPKVETVVSLSPAGTNLLAHTNANLKIIGVSAYEANDTLKATLPVVGDYERVDWEKLAELKPTYLLVQGKPDRLPSGLTQRCNDLGIALINIQIDRLSDIDVAIDTIRDAAGAARVLRPSIEIYITNRIGKPTSSPVPAMILISENGKYVIGKDNFIDDLLTLAGGQNVITSAGYPTIDQELFLTLKPEVIFVLLPSATDEVVKRTIETLHQAVAVPAIKNKRVIAITRNDVLLPSYDNAFSLAKEISQQLNPATTQPSK